MSICLQRHSYLLSYQLLHSTLYINIIYINIYFCFSKGGVIRGRLKRRGLIIGFTIYTISEVYGSTLSLDRLLQVLTYITRFGFGVNTTVNARVWLGWLQPLLLLTRIRIQVVCTLSIYACAHARDCIWLSIVTSSDRHSIGPWWHKLRQQQYIQHLHQDYT